MTVITPELEKLFKVDTFLASSQGAVLKYYMTSKHGWTIEQYEENRKLYADSILKLDEKETTEPGTKPKLYYSIYIAISRGIYLFNTRQFGEPNNWFETEAEAQMWIEEKFLDAQPANAEPNSLKTLPPKMLLVLPNYLVNEP